MLDAFLVFFWCFLKYNVTFKIINKLKVNNNHFKFNSNFKSYITDKRTLKKYLIYIYFV